VRDAAIEPAPSDHLRMGLRLSLLSIAWTVTTSTAAIAIGFATGALVLVAFGLVSVLDAVGSASLVVHFRHAMRHESISERHERIALSVVTLGLITVGLATLVESGRRVAYRVHASPAPVGVGLATVAVLVLTVLAWRKRRVGLAIPSRALVADGWLSATGALLALVTVAGTGLAAAYGWWWIDPSGAAVIGAAATGVGASMRRGVKNL
jgi:divalent metal cation (Fe/Co/Zn/Cd) transporter